MGLVQDTRVDIIVETEGETRVRDAYAVPKPRQYTAIRPGATSIERDIVPNLELVVGKVGEEFGATDQVEGVLRVFDHHRLTMCEIRIVAYLNVLVRGLRVITKLDTRATSSKEVERPRSRCRSAYNVRWADRDASGQNYNTECDGQ